jgi:CheY-like chemotaxis protein
VEDNPDCRVTLQLFLSWMGHVVEVAGDGLRGVHKALAWRPDVVIVDIGIPVLDGYEVARRVRAALGDRALLVALTEYDQPEDRGRAGEAGFDVYLAKPASPEEIACLVGRPEPVAGGVGARERRNSRVLNDADRHAAGTVGGGGRPGARFFPVGGLSFEEGDLP